MDEPMTLLFGLDEFVVVDVSRVEGATVRVVIETLAREGACPECGTLSARVKDRPLRRIKDLRASGQRVELWWRKRRLVCLPATCPRRSFLERTVAIPPRSRLTTRLREHLARAIAGSNRAVSEVAAEYGVAWHTAHRALVAAAARWLPAPTPTAVLGIDETRARSVRWLKESTGWKRSDPWLTSFVDTDPARRGLLLGLAPGRSGGCVKSWLAEQDVAFREQVQVVVIDPSAPYASGIRAALPHAQIAVDHFHLVDWPTRWSPTSANGSPVSSSVAAAPPPTRPGSTGGCCSPPGTGSHPVSCAASSGSSLLTTRRMRSALPGAAINRPWRLRQACGLGKEPVSRRCRWLLRLEMTPAWRAASDFQPRCSASAWRAWTSASWPVRAGAKSGAVTKFEQPSQMLA